MNEHPRTFRLLRLLLTGLLLMLTFWLAVSSLVRKSPTFDEQGFIVRGLAYIRSPEMGGTRHIRVGHPPGLNAYNALLLASDNSVKLPIEDPSWQGTSFHRPAELFLWEIGNDVAHIMFLARIQTVWLGLLLIAIVGRWAAELATGSLWRNRAMSPGTARDAAGSLALVLTALDPNLLAHMRLATTDFGLTAMAALAGFGTWMMVRRPSWPSAVFAGFGLGLILNTKFTALLFLPLFGITILTGLLVQWRSTGTRFGSRVRTLLIPFLLLLPLVALLTLWAGTGFDFGPMPAGMPIVGQLGRLRVPLSQYLDQLVDIGGRLQVETPAFLLGRYRTTGWWYYFPVTFLLKTPLPVLALLMAAIASTMATLWARRHQLAGADLLDLMSLLVPPVGFFAIALTTEINLGYRHIMPVLPFLFVLTGAALGKVLLPAATGTSRHLKTGRSVLVWVVIGLTGMLAFVSLRTYPHYLAYFNAIAGGSDNGWRSLVDSNLDWGQDLQALGPWMSANDVDHVWLSYFGEARPEYYGISYTGLDSFPPRLMNPEARPFAPSDPAPGWYAISATNLQGVPFLNRDEFAYFRERVPDAKLGYSIFLYEVPTHGEPVNLILSDLQPDEILPADWSRLGTNDVAMRWIDGRQAMISPNDDRPTWLVASPAALLWPDWTAVLKGAVEYPTVSDSGYTIWKLPGSRPEAVTVQSEFELAEGQIDFLESTELAQDGRIFQLVTHWQQRAQPTAVKIFIHVLDENGAIVSQWDGLGAAWEGWRIGDVLDQHHTLELPIDTPPGTYYVVAGLYDPDSQERWRLRSGAEFVELTQITIP